MKWTTLVTSEPHTCDEQKQRAKRAVFRSHGERSRPAKPADAASQIFCPLVWDPIADLGFLRYWVTFLRNGSCKLKTDLRIQRFVVLKIGYSSFVLIRKWFDLEYLSRAVKMRLGPVARLSSYWIFYLHSFANDSWITMHIFVTLFVTEKLWFGILKLK